MKEGVKKVVYMKYSLFVVCGLFVLTLVQWDISKNPKEDLKLQNSGPFELGQYYFNVGDAVEGEYNLEKAHMYYMQALQASSTANELAWYQLGRIEFIRGNFDKAIYDFKKQQQYFGDSMPSVYYMLGLTYGFKAKETGLQTDWDSGAEAFKKFLTYKSESPWARTDLAWIYFSQGRYEDMLPVLEEGLKQQPNQPWLNNMYGLALLNLGSNNEAEQHFAIALSEAKVLTPKDWGRAYPGNDPSEWQAGLHSFVNAIEKNLRLAQSDDK